MRVLKRDGAYEQVSFDKIQRRIRHFCGDLGGVDADNIAQFVCGRIYDGVKTCEIDELTAQLCSSKSTEHPDYGILAARISISNHHKTTSPSFSETISQLFWMYDDNKKQNPLVSSELYDIVQVHKEKLNSIIDYERDYLLDYFGFKTLERSYLLKINGKAIERPQHMWMRVALGIHGWDVKDAIESYELMSKRFYTHATPTLFNAGTPRPQMSSCFLMSIKDDQDSIEGMYDTVKDMCLISKYAGGIGLHVHNIRSRGSYIRGTNGRSTGLIPFCRVLNEATRHVNQSGKRNGSAAVYLEPWHSDVFDFVALRRNTGSEEERCRDLFLALWIPDLFMERVQKNETWSLFCPDEAPGLSECHGADFVELYTKYETEGRFKKQIKAQDLWFEIIKSQIETGGPYLLYKDKCQRSNQSNLGVIKSSNLCSEILLYSDPKEYGVCNLASIVLGSFVEFDAETKKPSFNFEKLHSITQTIIRSMEKVITRNFYPIPETLNSNMRHRPIGVGIQGLADTYVLMRFPYESAEAADLNRKISETIYHACLMSSMNISRERAEKIARLDDLRLQTGVIRDEVEKEVRQLELDLVLTDEERALDTYKGAYATFATSPAAKGILQFDMWGVTPTMYDWSGLKSDIMKHGIRHSVLVALMPTASTSQIMGMTESFEAITSNIYQRRTLAGEFTIINKYLIKDLIDLGIWNIDLKNRILASNGSIQDVVEIPEEIRALYKTVWEIKQKSAIDQSADRGPFVCHTQSLNLYLEDADMKKLTNMHFYGWSKGLKTGLYYLRTRPKAKTMSFTLDPSLIKKDARTVQQEEEPVLVCRKEEGCVMCSA